jgi:hypothetical protein
MSRPLIAFSAVLRGSASRYADYPSYQIVRRHVEAFIPQVFAPCEAYQFDWSHEHVEIGGIDQVVKVAHLRLCYSRAFFLSAYPRESQEMVFDAHARALAHLGGIPRRPPVHGEFQFCQCWRVMCSLANGWIVGHGHAYDGDLGNRRPPVGNRSPSRRARRGSRRDRRVTPSQASAADPQPIAQKSPETDALGSAAFRCRCLPGVSQTPPKDCDWNQTVNAAALSSGADPAEISTAVHAPSPPETRAERALEGTHRGDPRNEAPQSVPYLTSLRCQRDRNIPAAATLQKALPR